MIKVPVVKGYLINMLRRDSTAFARRCDIQKPEQVRVCGQAGVCVLWCGSGLAAISHRGRGWTDCTLGSGDGRGQKGDGL